MRKRPYWLGIVIFSLLIFTSGTASADLGGFTITRFRTDLTVEENSDLLVEERIDVDFTAQRHGIYRTIPIRYTDPRGFQYSLGFKLLGVEDGHGRARETKVTREGQYAKVRIGSPESTVSGNQTYVIRYRVQGAVARKSDHDEIYWNAVGDEWQTTIDSASAFVRLPSEIGRDEVSATGYIGAFGSGTEAPQIDYPAPGVISYSAGRTLQPREAMTIVAAWPQGYVSFPSAAVRFMRLLVNNIFALTPLVALAGLYWHYLRRGRDPQGAGSIVVRYEPPADVGPGEVGAIVDENIDMRDITAVVVSLAVRGYLSIGIEEKKRLFGTSDVPVFERNTEADTAKLRPHERMVLDGLFESGDRVTADDLSEAFYQHLSGIREAIYERLVSDGYFTADPSWVRIRHSILGFAAGLATIVAGTAWAVFTGGLLPHAAIVPVTAGILTVFVFAAFAPAMPRRTDSGVRVRDWALGFQEFVDRVESDKLASSDALRMFEGLLPYAMALGVAATWARKFEGIYRAAKPAWYSGPYQAGAFSTGTFERSLSAAMSETAKTMASTPRSSGSGGSGGFSGGGFGGGGGGSW